MLLLGACGRAEPEPAGSVISRQRFVAANVALRMLDSTATAAQRDSVLRRHRVTEEQLRGFVAAHAGDTVLAGVWEQIATGLEAAQPPRDTAPRTEPRTLALPPGR